MNKVRSNLEDIISRAFHIRTTVDNGTGVFIELDNRQYLVTAKHLVANATNEVLRGETIRAHGNDGQLTVVKVENTAFTSDDPDQGGTDVAVLEVAQPLRFDSDSPAIGIRDELSVLQPVAMLSAEHYAGFGPAFGIVTRSGNVAKIVKLGMRSKFTGDFLADITAYPGFSGSPIVSWNEEGKIILTGVAARFSWRSVPQLGINQAHTGFIGCFHFQHAIDLIRELQQSK